MILSLKTWPVLFLALLPSLAHAKPSKIEAYRNSKLDLLVFQDSDYKEGAINNVFWYLPQLKLKEKDGKILLQKFKKMDRSASDNTTKVPRFVYTLYIRPTLDDNMLDFLVREIKGIQNRAQLKPIVASRFGIMVKQFDLVSMKDILRDAVPGGGACGVDLPKITDYHYLGVDQPISFSLDEDTVEEFEFYLNQEPGVKADVVMQYDSERAGDYLHIEISHKEVYKALNMGATGKYQFSQAEIESGLKNYIATKYYNVKSKGDIPISDVINRVIQESFAPLKQSDLRKKTDQPPWFQGLLPETGTELIHSKLNEKQKKFLEMVMLEQEVSQLASVLVPQETLRGLMPDGNWFEPDPNNPINPGVTDPNSPGGKWPVASQQPQLKFQFKMELANSDQKAYFNHDKFVDALDVVALPIYLNTLPPAPSKLARVEELPRVEALVTYENLIGKPLHTGLIVKHGEQYIVDARFRYSAESTYRGQRVSYRWLPEWGEPNEDLYYRVGESAWQKVAGRAYVQADSVFQGELQFYLDKERIFAKIPEKYTKAGFKAFPFWPPAVFDIQKFFPQYDVVITGRRYL